MIRLHSYSGTQNLGDSIQSLALLRLCKELRPDLNYGWVDRDNPPGPSEATLANGWLGQGWRPMENSEFCGVHTSDGLIAERLSKFSNHVGARDPYTKDMMEREGVFSEMIGCATLTLPRYEGQRFAGMWLIDASGEFPQELCSTTHRIAKDRDWQWQLEVADQRLVLLQRAESVYTSRLHVLLPCIAFGTPVALTHIPPNEDRRFSLAKYLGVEVGQEPKVYDASELAAKFRAFTLQALNRLSPP